MIRSVLNSPLGLAVDDFAHDMVNLARGARARIVPASRREIAARRLRRANSDQCVADFSRAGGPVSDIHIDGAVIVDGMWDNAAHWLRYAMVRRALGLWRHREIGLTGRHLAAQVKDTFHRFGIDRVESFLPTPMGVGHCAREAKFICQGFTCAEDVLSHDWPANIPPGMVYDEILRRQKGGLVDVRHPRMEQHVRDLLRAIAMANALFDNQPVGLVVLSHLFTFNQAALIWVAMERGIPAIVVQSAFGVMRILRMTTPDDYLEYSNAPNPGNIEQLTKCQRDSLGEVGRAYMAQRFAGKGEDVGSIYAYIQSRSRTNRDEICRTFGWPTDRPVIAIYASKWFDTPHAYGMENFRDFLDWTHLTLGIAKERTDISWLIKPHPIDKWYGGITLRDLVDPEIADHIGIADDSWHSKDVMDAVDALITTHGTAGVEYSFAGKPVLCADRGWYSRHDFVTYAPSREAYLALLRDSWWQGHNPESASDASALFAGLFYGVPAWQEGLIMPDDLLQDEVCDVIAPLISDNAEAMETELTTIRQWYDSGSAAYHPFKMLAAKSYGDIISSRRIDKRYNPEGR